MSRREAFVGIDVAFAKRKRLPICICTWQHNRLVPISIPKELLESHPRGHGNKGTLNAALVSAFADEAAAYLRRIESHLDLAIRRIAIDAPQAPKALHETLRQCEAALGEKRISCFTTPSSADFGEICTKATEHLEKGGAESRLPYANKLWMLVGFALFHRLEKEWECIEVYPQATIRVLGAGDIPKRERRGAVAQLQALSRYTGWPSREEQDPLDQLRQRVQSPYHDALDAYSSAWIASLEPPHRVALGRPPRDAIWVPGESVRALEAKAFDAKPC